MSNTESTSARLRRVADKKIDPFTFWAVCNEFEVAETPDWGDLRSVLYKIADEIDREMDELRKSFANPTFVNIEDAVCEVALGIDDHGRTKAAIDRYYLPRPLFEDGEPVYIGAEIDDRKRGKLEVSRVCYTKSGFYFNNSRGSNGRKMKGITYEYGERVGRPKKPALDAYGVPIEVGDVGWLIHLREPIKVRVEEISQACKWVRTISLDEDHDLDEHFLTTWDKFSHREPDTQERIDEDAQKCAFDYWRCNGVGCRECPSMIDGEKPRHRYGVDWCSDAKTLDLLRRQRELDSKEGK